MERNLDVFYRVHIIICHYGSINIFFALQFSLVQFLEGAVPFGGVKKGGRPLLRIQAFVTVPWFLNTDFKIKENS